MGVCVCRDVCQSECQLFTVCKCVWVVMMCVEMTELKPVRSHFNFTGAQVVKVCVFIFTQILAKNIVRLCGLTV